MKVMDIGAWEGDLITLLEGPRLQKPSSLVLPRRTFPRWGEKSLLQYQSAPSAWLRPEWVMAANSQLDPVPMDYNFKANRDMKPGSKDWVLALW